jgi:hypothetical protein
VWHALIGIVVLLVIIGVAIWAGRTKPTGGNGSNTDAATRYGPGYHGP